MTRITHHDLRHFFATVCIESGVDIPTVSRWLGHRDGRALAMRTYGGTQHGAGSEGILCTKRANSARLNQSRIGGLDWLMGERIRINGCRRVHRNPAFAFITPNLARQFSVHP
ncbi:MAG: tyrosine-type recombinase/integrase [Verrucomicrobiota bacterium]